MTASSPSQDGAASASSSPGTLVCFGYGHSAQALADLLRPHGWRIVGTCRSEEKQARLKAQGVEAYLFDGQSRSDELDAVVSQATHLLHSIPPAREGSPADPVAALYGGLIASNPNLQWLAYLSTTGIYGDHQGGWVDEEMPRTPAGPRGAARCHAEEAWETLMREKGVPLHIFRLAGIYGPHSSQLKSVRQGKARRIVKPGHVFSRIHVADIAQVLKASLDRPQPGAIYNVCDDEAAPPQDVVAYAADLLGQPAPPEVPFEEAELSPMGRSFYEECKKVSNRRLHDELGVTLLYPTYREGLQALFEAGDF